MVGSMYAAISGLRAHQQKMNVIGNNIANVNTYGYKTQRTTFSESMYSSVRNSTEGTNVSGGVNAAQIGYGCNVGTIDMNMRTGSYAVTDSPLDIMIDGDGFLMVGSITPGYDVADSGDMASLNLSRVGNLRLDNNGYITDGKGNVVYGFVKENGQTSYDVKNLVPLRLPPAKADDLDGERMALNSISISENGIITGMDGNNKPVEIGCIALGYVDNPTGLTHMGGPYYKAGGNSGALRAGTCNDAVKAPAGSELVKFTSQMKSGTLEMSNVDISSEFADLITTQRGFQANTKIITVTDEMLSDLVSMKR